MAGTMRLYPTFGCALAVAAALLLAACKDGSKTDGAEAPADAAGPPVRVAVLTVNPHRVVVYDELPGRVSALRTAEIRPQVNGIIQRVLFTEGTEVAADQPLFQIDPAPFAADAEAAAAILARAEADLLNATAKHNRVQALAAARIASPATLGDATTTLAQARASVAEAKANLTRRELERAHATVRSPIPGRIGQALVTEGSLASVGAQTPLAVVQQIDRVYLDVRQPSMRRELLEEMLGRGRSEDAGALPVDIQTITGKPYPYPGKILFSDSTVDPGTGSIAMRVEVPNPDRQLLPGLYLRAKVPRAIYSDALTVPQEAVRRDASGRPSLTILVDDKTVANRNVELGALVDRQYVVLSGLRAGETVIVQGQARTDMGQPLELVRYEPAKPQSES